MSVLVVSPFSACSGLLLTPQVVRWETNRERSGLQVASEKPTGCRVHSYKHLQCLLSHPSHFETLYIWYIVYVNTYWILFDLLLLGVYIHTHTGSSFSTCFSPVWHARQPTPHQCCPVSSAFSGSQRLPQFLCEASAQPEPQSPSVLNTKWKRTGTLRMEDMAYAFVITLELHYMAKNWWTPDQDTQIYTFPKLLPQS